MNELIQDLNIENAIRASRLQGVETFSNGTKGFNLNIHSFRSDIIEPNKFDDVMGMINPDAGEFIVSRSSRNLDYSK